MNILPLLNYHNLDKHLFILMLIIFNDNIFNYYYIISNFNVILHNKILNIYLSILQDLNYYIILIFILSYYYNDLILLNLIKFFTRIIIYILCNLIYYKCINFIFLALKKNTSHDNLYIQYNNTNLI